MPGVGRPLSSIPWMQRTSSALQHELHARRSHATASRAHEVAEVEKSSLRVNPARLVEVKIRSAGQVGGRLSVIGYLTRHRTRAKWLGWKVCLSARKSMR